MHIGSGVRYYFDLRVRSTGGHLTPRQCDPV